MTNMFRGTHTLYLGLTRFLTHNSDYCELIFHTTCVPVPITKASAMVFAFADSVQTSNLLGDTEAKEKWLSLKETRSPFPKAGIRKVGPRSLEVYAQLCRPTRGVRDARLDLGGDLRARPYPQSQSTYGRSSIRKIDARVLVCRPRATTRIVGDARPGLQEEQSYSQSQSNHRRFSIPWFGAIDSQTQYAVETGDGTVRRKRQRGRIESILS